MFVRFVPSWILNEYPWLADVLAFLQSIQELWHEYQSLVILAGLFLVARLLRHERLKLSERVDTLSQIVKAARDEAEAAIAQPAEAPAQPNGSIAIPSGGASAAVIDGAMNWEIIRSGWRDVRDRLELAIEGIRHRAVRGKYSKIPRYAYRDVINALQKDGELSAQVANHLRSMDTTFNILRFRPRTTTNDDVTSFTASLEFIDPHLPKLPDDESEPSPDLSPSASKAAQPA